MHIGSDQAVRTCLARSNCETQTAHTGTRTCVEISSGRLCDDTHDIATGRNHSLSLLSRYQCADRHNYRKVCSSSLDFYKKIAETVQLSLNGWSIFLLLMHYLLIPSLFYPKISPEQPKHETGAEWARRKSDENRAMTAGTC